MLGCIELITAIFTETLGSRPVEIVPTFKCLSGLNSNLLSPCASISGQESSTDKNGV